MAPRQREVKRAAKAEAAATAAAAASTDQQQRANLDTGNSGASKATVPSTTPSTATENGSATAAGPAGGAPGGGPASTEEAVGEPRKVEQHQDGGEGKEEEEEEDDGDDEVRKEERVGSRFPVLVLFVSALIKPDTAVSEESIGGYRKPAASCAETSFCPVTRQSRAHLPVSYLVAAVYCNRLREPPEGKQ